MKRRSAKLIGMVTALSLVLSLILVGCGGNSNSTSSNAGGEKKTSQKVTIKIGHVGAPVSPQSDIGNLFAKKVAEKTNGSVEIKLYGASQLGSEKDLQQGVKAGTVDGCIAGSWESYISWAGIFQTPLIYRDMDHFKKVFTGPVGQDLMDTIEKEVGVKPLFIAPHGTFRYITNSVRPIKTPDDMKGLKLRDPNMPCYSVVSKALEANPLPMDFSELYVALDRKVVDGQHNPLSHIVGSKFYEVQKYLSMVPYGMPPHTVTISKNAWNKLDPEQQKQVMEAAKETANEYPSLAQKNDDELLKQLDGKIEILKPDQIDIAAFQKIFNEKCIPELNKAYGEQGAKYLKAVLETK